MQDEMQPLEPQQPEFTQEPTADIGMSLPNGEVDHEGAMAKADLYKLANYSFKLFKKLQDDDQLEGWVQAKITKAADYIASVYHYLEYEMKFSEYGKSLDNSDVLSESQKAVLKNKLMEAKAKMKELKKAQAKKVDEDMKVGDKKKSSTGGTIEKTKSGVKHTADSSKFTDEPHTEPKSLAKSRSASDKADDKAADKKQAQDSKNYEKKNPGSVKRYVDGKLVKEGAKPDFLDMDKDGDKKEPMKKAVADKKKNPFAKKDAKVDEALKGKQKNLDADKDGDIEADDLADLRAKKEKKVDEAKTCNETSKGESCPVHGLKECGTMKEGAKPSAGMTKKEKSATVKDAKAGKDIGKPGKSFDKVAKNAGGGEKGKKIAAAAMWKSIKENVQQQMVPQVEPSADTDLSEANMTDEQYKAAFEEMRKTNPQAIAKALNSSDPMALNKLLKFKMSPGEKYHQAVGDDDQGTLAPVKKPVVKESADLDRMKQFLTRLNG